ncbi:glutamate receptor ionotropic kainate 4 [Clonorchis sinensis]|uniref:Glutamate receptor ionotropic kainate 4 n=1 Tax=Clonorchis sinensis TaxID=79923 RepID=G7YN91_CLOSI|nr:glutamate receptor ionotropic kainate 4 [Clonorchis sinensis]
MTAAPTECPSFELIPNNLEASNTTVLVGVPSIRFPSAAEVAALSAFGSRLASARFSDTVFATDEYLGPNSLFSDFGALEFVGRYFIKLQSDLSQTDMLALLEKLHRIVHSQLWSFKVNQPTMRRVLNSLAIADWTNDLLETAWMLYDESLNEAVSLTVHLKLMCRCRFFVQLGIVSAYEAVKTTALALGQLIMTAQWPESIDDNEVNLCNVSPPKLNVSTRYYKFAEAVRKLPSRIGAAGEIVFNGSVFNHNARVRLMRCDTDGSKSSNRCEDMDPPFVIKTEDGWTGYSVEVFEKIADALGLDYVYIEQLDHIYGVKLPNGHWNGVIGEIASKHADVGLGPIVQDGERKLVVDFTIPYYVSAGLAMVVSTKTDQELGPFFFLEVFTGPVWICCITAVVFVSLLVYALDRFSPYSFQNQALKDNGASEAGTMFTLKESVWYVLGACTQQGESLDPRSTSTRILITGHWIFVVIMVSMFSANLSARLTVSGLKEEIKSLEQLAGQTEVKYTLRSDSAEYAFFRKMYEVEESLFRIWRYLSSNLTEFSSNYSVWQYPITERYGTIFKRMEEWGFTQDTVDSLAHVRKGWVVFMESSLAAYHIASACDLKELGERIGSWDYGIALPLKSFLTPNMNSMILHLKAENILDDLEHKWWSTNITGCPEPSASIGFGLEQVGGMFIILACGFLSAALILGMELLFYRVILKRLRKGNKTAPMDDEKPADKADARGAQGGTPPPALVVTPPDCVNVNDDSSAPPPYARNP